MIKISESLFAVPTDDADPEKVKELSDKLFAAYEKAIEQLNDSLPRKPES